MEKVELHPAHVWDCPECGRENFCRGIVYEMTQEERQELKEIAAAEAGINPEDVADDSPCLQTGFWMTAPREVICAHCGKEFESFDQREE